MDTMTIYVNKIGNGYTVNRTLYKDGRMETAKSFYFEDIEGVKRHADFLIATAEADAEAMPEDAEPAF